MRFRTYEGIQVFLDLGAPGILLLIVLAICIVGTAVWLWRKIRCALFTRFYGIDSDGEKPSLAEVTFPAMPKIDLAANPFSRRTLLSCAARSYAEYAILKLHSKSLDCLLSHRARK
jgi:hypothetical protein